MSPDPVAMPEVTWTYRRVYAYGRTLLFTALLAYLCVKIRDESTLRAVALSLCAMKFADALLYMCGATATDITRLLKAVRSGRRPSGSPS